MWSAAGWGRAAFYRGGGLQGTVFAMRASLPSLGTPPPPATSPFYPQPPSLGPTHHLCLHRCVGRHRLLQGAVVDKRVHAAGEGHHIVHHAVPAVPSVRQKGTLYQLDMVCGNGCELAGGVDATEGRPQAAKNWLMGRGGLAGGRPACLAAAAALPGKQANESPGAVTPVLLPNSHPTPTLGGDPLCAHWGGPAHFSKMDLSTERGVRVPRLPIHRCLVGSPDCKVSRGK